MATQAKTAGPWGSNHYSHRSCTIWHRSSSTYRPVNLRWHMVKRTWDWQGLPAHALVSIRDCRLWSHTDVCKMAALHSYLRGAVTDISTPTVRAIWICTVVVFFSSFFLHVLLLVLFFFCVPILISFSSAPEAQISFGEHSPVNTSILTQKNTLCLVITLSGDFQPSTGAVVNLGFQWITDRWWHHLAKSFLWVLRELGTKQKKMDIAKHFVVVVCVPELCAWMNTTTLLCFLYCAGVSAVMMWRPMGLPSMSKWIESGYKV